MWHPESIFDASGHLDEGVVHAWLDDQLAPEAATQVEQHAADCASCSAMVAEARGLVAGASRVLSSLDEPAVGHAPARDPLIGIVAAASAKPATSTGSRDSVRRWSTRRISLAAAAALVFVTGTLVLRDSGTVQQMVQVGELEQDSVSGPAAPALSPEAATDVSPADQAAPAPSAANTAERSEARDASPQAASSPQAPPSAAKASAPSGFVGRLGGVAGSATADAGAGLQRPAPPPPQRNQVSGMAQSTATPPPPPAPVQAAPQASVGAATVASRAAVERGAVERGQVSATDEAVRARELAVARDVASRRIGAPAAADRQLLAPEVQSAPNFNAEARPGAVRTSAEIQAMVLMVSSCWRIAGTDSVLELLPPGSSGAASGAPGGRSSLWIAGWLRLHSNSTNPARIWWRPLGDSVSARVRLDDAASPDLVITPRPDAARVWRVPRADSLATWASIPRGAPAGHAGATACEW